MFTLAASAGLQVAVWHYAINAVIVLIFTTLMVLWELEQKNRRFPWTPIVFTWPFAILTALQGLIVFGFLLVLTALERAALWPAWDALWVSLAGLSVLKNIPVGKEDAGQRLWGLAEWLFKRFYRQLSIIIIQQSNVFKAHLQNTYANDAPGFLVDAQSFIQANTDPNDAPKEIASVNSQFNSLSTSQQQVNYLANYVAPRTTRAEWRRLTGK